LTHDTFFREFWKEKEGESQQHYNNIYEDYEKYTQEMDPTTGAISEKEYSTDTLNHQLNQHITTETPVPQPTQIVTLTHENAEYNTKLKIDKLLCDMLQWKCEWLDDKEDQLLVAGEGVLIPMMYQYVSYKSYMRYAVKFDDIKLFPFLFSCALKKNSLSLKNCETRS
jgi:hypothetical protein